MDFRNYVPLLPSPLSYIVVVVKMANYSGRLSGCVALANARGGGSLGEEVFMHATISYEV